MMLACSYTAASTLRLTILAIPYYNYKISMAQRYALLSGTPRIFDSSS
jgi:hypothetical protein